MLDWLKSLRGDGEGKRLSAELELSRELAPAVANVLQLPIRASGRTPETFYTEQPVFFCGYVVGLSDVLGQAAGGEPGGNLSQNLALRLMIELLGQSAAERAWPQLMSYMNGSSSEFERGMSIGGQDGNRVSSKGLPRNLGEHLGLRAPGTNAP